MEDGVSQESISRYSFISSLISLSHAFNLNHIKIFYENIINGSLFKYDNVQVFLCRLFLARLTCHYNNFINLSVILQHVISQIIHFWHLKYFDTVQYNILLMHCIVKYHFYLGTFQYFPFLPLPPKKEMQFLPANMLLKKRKMTATNSGNQQQLYLLS